MLPLVDDAVMQVVERASTASDRWLFLFFLALLLVTFGAIIRYLLRSHEKLQSEHAALIKTIYTENIKMSAELVVVVAENTELLKHLSRFLERAEQQRPQNS